MKLKHWLFLGLLIPLIVAATLPTGQVLTGADTGYTLDLNADPASLNDTDGTTPIIQWDSSGVDLSVGLGLTAPEGSDTVLTLDTENGASVNDDPAIYWKLGGTTKFITLLDNSISDALIFYTSGFSPVLSLYASGQVKAGINATTNYVDITNSDATLNVFRDMLAANTNSPVATITEASPGDDQPALKIAQYGGGDILSGYYGTTKIFRITNNGNVGIGNSDPTADEFQIGSLTAGAAQSLSLMNEGGDVGYYESGIRMRMHTNNYGFDILNANRSGGLAGLDIIRHNNSTAGTTALFINMTTGNVGIANADPQYELDVNGDVKFTGKKIVPPLTFSPVLATDEIPCTAAKVKLYNSSAGTLTLGSASGEVIDTTGAVDGQELVVYNAGYINGRIVILSVASPTNTWSKVISKTGNDITLSFNTISPSAYKMGSAKFTFDATKGCWVEF